jgi:flagellar hook-length control protein FliK
MLDLNNVTLSSLLALNIQEGVDSDSLTFNIDEQQDDDNSIDPGAFVLLFAQIANIPVEEPQKTVASDLASTIEKQPIIAENKSPVGQELNLLDDNIALTWINSDYYQAELDAKSTSFVVNSDNESNNDSKQVLTADLTENAEFTVNSSSKPFDNQEQLTTSSVAFVDDKNPVVVKEVLPQAIAVSKFNLEAVNQSEESEADIQIIPDADNEKIDLNLSQILQPKTASTPTQAKVMDSKPESQILIKNPVKVASDVVNVNQVMDKPFLQVRSSKIENDSELSEESYVANDKAVVMDFDALIKPKMNVVTETQLPVHMTQQPVIDAVMQSNQMPNSMAQPVAVENNPLTNSLTNDISQEFSIPTEITDPQWSKQFSDHVVWMSQQGTKTAVIKLHPEDLGPLEINIKMVQDSASVTIVSHSSQVREMIDQSMPRLQAMMAEQGLNLSEMNINSDSGERHFSRQDNSGFEGTLISVDEEVMTTPVIKKAVPQGVIDYFA